MQSDLREATKLKVSGHVGGGLGGVESQLQGVVPPVQRRDSPGPDGGDVVPLVELPVKRKDPVEVQSQTAAVVHHHPEFFPLWGVRKKHTDKDDAAEKSCMTLAVEVLDVAQGFKAQTGDTTSTESFASSNNV
ncbi:hypothetical protein EYF80_018538 [Liparis tanakae]|uniref:Uncharacterized protein n=1 Tax=Liparis tanakae TaxID=230148 RepID=A0A4Z2I061_9TELE|nr:hypothetical protein EYF80_018538 [Liparis tanakae]